MEVAIAGGHGKVARRLTRLRAKARADGEVRAAGLDHTIVRPGSLSDENGTGKGRIERDVPGGEITRDDVAEAKVDRSLVSPPPA